ncbi:hypothetical protein IGB42_01889 [Andreprevotia sp. IGB-42]|uniref:hypothetical protein n=1 Tax=Andreprevotia sp. IGB-42 TaxID=2497473 RepID=UPI00135B5FDB|nr:hypothetical protein [Andreprevotia sp. IGB-42]KAF0813538.1 hypothetical protein IGB42_01889 [Andreprevotia sp. IGB-42]
MSDYPAPAIDPASGHVRLHDCLITPATQLSELPPDFAREPIAQPGQQLVFAKRHWQNKGVAIEFSLRFEAGVLVSVFIALEPPEHQNLDSDAFYRSTDERYAWHQRWLGKQIGTAGHFAWGNIGVARSKSEDVWVYLHNPNNSWGYQRT